nr:hypothetical protein [Nocardia crassostreae]
MLGRVVRGFNGAMVALMHAPVIGPRMRKGLVEITYQGRRSGRTFRTPVAYWWTGDAITIGVALPDKKTWWRNFLGEGHPITLHLDGGDRTGLAVAHRDKGGEVTVKVKLED